MMKGIPFSATPELATPVASPATRSVTVRPEDSGERLDRLLARDLGENSRSQLKRLIQSGRLSHNGMTITDPSIRVKPGQVFTLTLPDPVADDPEPQAISLDIRFEDEQLLVLDKPAGMVVHPAPGNPDRTLVNALLAHCGDSLSGIGGVRRPGIVHRLDKETSGLMVVAKTDLAHQKLSAAFAVHSLLRVYRAAVWGVPHPATGTIEGNIGRSPVDRKKMAVVARGGKQALTRYEVLKSFRDKAALVECRLATGRTHQIRVHMSERGHPLIGDPCYGRRPGAKRLDGIPEELRREAAAFQRQALHSYRLGFEHPSSGAWLEFESALPRDFDHLVRVLERF
jgi:23S rRNA pseudouridine1911/1915/1917 synthase